MNHDRTLRRRGFSLIEAVGATLIVSIMLVAALRASTAAAMALGRAAEQATGRFLADGLMADIIQNPYEQPGTVGGSIGRESGEPSSSKANYNDVDDFNGWTESPPQDRSGTVIAGLEGWQRSVAVDWIAASSAAQTDITQVLPADSGAKRITVEVRHNGVLVCRRTAIKTRTQ